MPKKNGFTLVELLVVTSIIAILSVIGITIFTGAQKAARDGKRRADIQAIHQALEQYKLANGSYPATVQQSCNPTGVTGGPNCPTTNQGDISQWTNAVGGSSYYSSGSAPADPLNVYNGTWNFTYYYYGNSGKVCAWRMEINTGSGSPDGDYCISGQQ